MNTNNKKVTKTTGTKVVKKVVNKKVVKPVVKKVKVVKVPVNNMGTSKMLSTKVTTLNIYLPKSTTLPSNFKLVNKYNMDGKVITTNGSVSVKGYTCYTVVNPIMLKNRGIVKYMVLVPNTGEGKTVVFGNFKSGNTHQHDHLPTKHIQYITNLHNSTLVKQQNNKVK